MGFLILKVLVSWSAIAVVTGFTVGAMISRSDRVRKDVFLSCVFSYMETMRIPAVNFSARIAAGPARPQLIQGIE